MKIISTDAGCKINGEVDVATSGAFRSALEDEISQGKTTIVLDMSEMEYIDSTGIGVLMDLKKNCMAPEQNFLLFHPKRSIVKLMQLTGVDNIFEIQTV